MALLGRCRPLCAAFAHPPLLIFAGVVWTACLFRDWKWLCLERCHLLRASFTLPTHPPFLNIRAGCVWTACWNAATSCAQSSPYPPTHRLIFARVARGQPVSFAIGSGFAWNAATSCAQPSPYPPTLLNFRGLRVDSSTLLGYPLTCPATFIPRAPGARRACIFSRARRAPSLTLSRARRAPSLTLSRAQRAPTRWQSRAWRALCSFHFSAVEMARLPLLRNCLLNCGPTCWVGLGFFAIFVGVGMPSTYMPRALNSWFAHDN